VTVYYKCVEAIQKLQDFQVTKSDLWFHYFKTIWKR